jgi:hypothetical protein
MAPAKTTGKKGVFASLLNTFFRQANESGLLDKHPQIAVDATQAFENRHTPIVQ